MRALITWLTADSAIAVENIFYMLSVALFILSGAAALLLSFRLPKVLRYSSYGIVAGATVWRRRAARGAA